MICLPGSNNIRWEDQTDFMTLNDALLHHPPDPTAVTVACDMEGTLTAGQTWKGMRNYLQTHGHRATFRRFYWRHLPGLLRFKLGFIEERPFKEGWILDLLYLFKGFRRETFQEMAVWVVEEELWPQRRQVMVDELRQHRQNGRRVIIISGMFEPILEYFVQKLGNFEAIGTPIAFQDDQFTGRLCPPLNVGPHKVTQLQPFANDGKIESAYGDTLRDIPMLEMSHHPVAVHPDARLHEVAQARGWRILVA